MILYHYAVWKGGRPFMEPACVTDKNALKYLGISGHGLTLNRGDVNCPECKRMMGMV